MGKLDAAQQNASGATKQQPAGSTKQACPYVVCNPIVPPAPADIIGKCEYYTWREKNFRERHVGCGHTPPTYYLGYGHKYCVKFSTELHPKLSAKGQQWLTKTRELLQTYLERELLVSRKAMELELDSAKLKKLAFDIHPKAYWNAGLAEVPLGDKLKILATPDLKEWKDWDTWRQGADVAGRQVAHDANESMKAYGEAKMREAEAQMEMSRMIVDFFRNLFK